MERMRDLKEKLMSQQDSAWNWLVFLNWVKDMSTLETGRAVKKVVAYFKKDVPVFSIILSQLDPLSNFSVPKTQAGV
jgi:hypothetical protein